jgi:hypothetical protein
VRAGYRAGAAWRRCCRLRGRRYKSWSGGRLIARGGHRGRFCIRFGGGRVDGFTAFKVLSRPIDLGLRRLGRDESTVKICGPWAIPGQPTRLRPHVQKIGPWFDGVSAVNGGGGPSEVFVLIQRERVFEKRARLRVRKRCGGGLRARGGWLSDETRNEKDDEQPAHAGQARTATSAAAGHRGRSLPGWGEQEGAAGGSVRGLTLGGASGRTPLQVRVRRLAVPAEARMTAKGGVGGRSTDRLPWSMIGGGPSSAGARGGRRGTSARGCSTTQRRSAPARRSRVR